MGPCCDTVNKAEQDKWRAEDDLRTLLAATAIKKDKARYVAALRIAKEQRDNLKSVASEALDDEDGDE
jgi:hypothetical protein